VQNEDSAQFEEW